MTEEITWLPQAKQEMALVRREYEIGFGGARGGGKSDAGRAWLLYEVEHPRFRALVLRRNADDLRDWVDKAEQLYIPMGARRRGNPAEFVFPSGAIIRTGHLKDKNAYSKYQGHEYQRMVLEELTQIADEDDYLKVRASCRSTIPEIQPQIFSTFNPDGAGFYWVRRRFNIHGIPQRPVFTIDKKTGLSRVFIPSRLEDNKFLNQDTIYRSSLEGLPDGLRQAWLMGSWEDPIIDGAYYTSEMEQARNEGRIGIVPFDPMLKVHTVWDLGVGEEDAMAIGFWQRTGDSMRLIRYYESTGEGLQYYFAYLDKCAKDFGYNYGRHFWPHDAQHKEKSSGQTLVDTAKKMGFKAYVLPMPSIADGIQKVRLMFPKVRMNELTTEAAIAAWRNYRREWDEKMLRYKDHPVHDWSSHCADMLRYAALAEPMMLNGDEARYKWKQKDRGQGSTT